MTPTTFFDELVCQYKAAEALTVSCHRTNVFRGRQHNISSIAEDMFAALLCDIVTPEFPDINLYFMVDYPMRPGCTGPKMFPDVAIIAEGEQPVLVSYLDLKTDLGYKRSYYKHFPAIKACVDRLRNANNTGTTTIEGKPILVSKHLEWRTVVISNTNISTALLQQNINTALAYANVFELYFLSGKAHPNKKVRAEIEVYEEPFRLLSDQLRADIQKAYPVIKSRKTEFIQS